MLACSFAAFASPLPCLGCAPRPLVPPAAPMVDAYARALDRGDADALYDMMSAASRRAVSRPELGRILAGQRQELARHARALRSPDAVTRTEAQLVLGEGEIVTLELGDGSFRVAAADALPGAARTPAQALGQLRQVLARRSYAGLLRTLSPRTGSALERDLRSLVDGLAEPAALDIEVVGDEASVELPGGHRVKLRREDGVWYVDDLD
ncbi:MAG: hypothetical protein HY744_07995 [Deltaproteobacteria bacterium]|nr:hypothetical protein [Deltaproteobacteria bacterium]